MRPQIEQKSDHVTLRVKIIKKVKSTQSMTNANLTLHIFKVEIIDISAAAGGEGDSLHGCWNGNRAYLMVKHASSKQLHLIEQ